MPQDKYGRRAKLDTQFYLLTSICKLFVISGFSRFVNEICALLGQSVEW
jgi:hypothetical protein